MKLANTILIAAAVALSGPAWAQHDDGAVPVARPDDAARHFTLEDMGAQAPLRLRTAHAQYSLPFAVRNDQLVKDAELAVSYRASPMLSAARSQVNVYLNDEIVQSWRLESDAAGGETRRFRIDPTLFVVFNQLRFEFIGKFAAQAEGECEDPLSAALWLEISQHSQLDLSLSQLPLPLDLRHLPAPFFDAADPRRVRLPVSLLPSPSNEVVDAALVVASWFGAQADYRGAEFPVFLGRLPERGPAIVLRSSAQQFPELGLAPPGPRPRVDLMAHPQMPATSLLVISALDARQVADAARALVYGYAGLSGSSAELQTVSLPAPRGLNDSPRWLQPVAGELDLTPLMAGALTARGLSAGPIDVEFRLPPDLFFLNSASPTLKFDYRASMVAVDSGSTLSAILNGQFADQLRLERPFGGSAVDARMGLPASQFTHRNRLDWQFNFVKNTERACQAYAQAQWEGSIDQQARIDLPRTAYYARMPDLHLLRDGGFPFTRFADGSQTAFVLPATADEQDLSAALSLAGYLGREGGLPLLRIASYRDSSNLSELDRDLLVIGKAHSLPSLKVWAERMPLSFNADDVLMRRDSWVERFQAWMDERDLDGARQHAGEVALRAGRDLAALMAFESPHFAGRSIVVLAGGADADLPAAASALIEPGRSQYIRGDLALFNGDQVSGYDLGPRYAVGQLPWDYRVLTWLRAHPYIIVPLLLLAVLLFIIVVRASLAARDSAR